MRQLGQLQTRGPGQQRACSALPTGDDDNYVINTDNDNDDINYNDNDNDDNDDMLCLQVIAATPMATPSDHSHCSETGRSLSAASDNPQYLRVFSE